MDDDITIATIIIIIITAFVEFTDFLDLVSSLFYLDTYLKLSELADCSFLEFWRNWFMGAVCGRETLPMGANHSQR